MGSLGSGDVGDGGAKQHRDAGHLRSRGIMGLHLLNSLIIENTALSIFPLLFQASRS